MSTTTARRGKKKTQPPKQQTLTGSRLQFAADDDAPLLSNSQQPPAFATATKAPPCSPAVQLVQKAVSPVVAAAKAISAAVESLAPVPEDAAVDVGQELPSTPRANAAASADKQAAQEEQAQVQEEQPAAPASQPAPSLKDADELGGDAPAPQHGRFSSSSGAQACSAALERVRRSRAAALVQGAGGLRLLACVASAAILAAVLVTQGSMLQAQAGALAAQQQHMARQAQALQALQHQLPSLAQFTRATSDSVSQLSQHQAALHTNLAALQSVTTWLNSTISSVNLTSQHGQQAWELLAAVAGTGQAGGGESAGATSAGSPNWLQQAVQQAQEQQAAAQQALLARQLASALPQLDLALADCGAAIVASTTPNLTSALHHHHQLQQRGWRHSSNSLGSMAQRVAASVRQHLAPTGSTATTDSAADGRLSALHAALLHRVVLRPASQLLQASACIPFAWALGPAGPAVIEIQLPQPAHITSVTLHAPGPAGGDASWQATTAPGRVALLLANSSACGGPSAACSAALDSARPSHGGGARDEGAVSEPGVVEVVEWAASLDASSYASGRAVLPVSEAAGGGSVRADRVVVVVRDVVGGRGAAPHGPCLARISVQGRPVDAHAFC